MFQLIYIKKCRTAIQQQVERLPSISTETYFVFDLHSELVSFTELFSSCVGLWSSYCAQTQTAFHQCGRTYLPHRNKRLVKDLSKNCRYLMELHQTILRLQSQHQHAIIRVLNYYRTRLVQGDSLSTFVPYRVSDQADTIFVAVLAMYYSTIQLAEKALALGTVIHIIFELETTSAYQKF